MLHSLKTATLIEVPFAGLNAGFPIDTQGRHLSRTLQWDIETLSPHVSVMSLPSPDGSTSSVVSSEDSTSSSSQARGRQLNHIHLHRRNHQHPPQVQPLPSPSALMVGPNVGQLSSRPVKICGVCGDRAKSYHFGGISCDSCKAFFRRSVQNDAYKNFHCPYDGQCDITIMSRKCCQHCRFQKCVSIGMEKSWVMTEEERLQMVKSRLEKRQKQDAKESCRSSKHFDETPRFKCDFEPDINVINSYLSDEEVNLIESIINHYLKSCKEISFNEELSVSKLPRNRTEILDMFFTAIQQFALFAQRFEAFKKVSPHDQELLLRGGVLELCFVRGAFLFDIASQSWPENKSSATSSGPYLAVNDLKPLIRDDLIEKHMRFIKLIKDIDVDESTVMLLCVIILLSPDRLGLTDAHIICKQQEFFLILLRKYMNWRYSEKMSSILYPKLLLTLPELRELSEGHTDYHLWLCREELEEIQSRLSSLRLDPLNTQRSNDTTKSPPFVCWTLRANLPKRASSFDEELSTSSESSEKLLPSD